VVVTVCGGSGMDAELLAAMGCRVIATDVSVGATRRAHERAHRHGIDVLALAAAAERLPLRDGAVDVAFVHDGLHHLEDPLAGLREMARVARRAVVVSEPGLAAATRLAVGLGLAADVESGGNRVARLDAHDVERELRAHGFSDVRSHRYGMHYRPEVGPVVRSLSRPRLLRPARAALLAANHLAGGLGNKLVVHGVRPDGARLGSPPERFSGEPSAHAVQT
jgi:SAM-dependent methyltransferase